MLVLRAKMFDDDLNPRNSGDRGQKKPPGGFKVPMSTWILWIAILGALMALVMLRSRMTTQGEELSQSEFWQKFSSNQIARATINLNSQSSPLTPVTGFYYKTDKSGSIVKENGKPVELQFSAPNVMLAQDMLKELLLSGKFEPAAPNAMLWSFGYQLVIFMAIGLLFWFFLIRPIKVAGKGALSFGRSKARMLSKDRNKTTFKDVAGIDEAIEEVSELVEFLKDPKKFQRLGFCGDVRRRRRQPRARHVRAGASQHAVPRFH